MSRGSRICWLATVVLLAAAGSAQAADLAGDYVILDGKYAGTPLIAADGAGHLDRKRNDATPATGFIRAPNDRCRDHHFEGRIQGKKVKADECVRVIQYAYAQPFLTEMGAAIREELGANGAGDIKDSIKALDRAFTELEAGLAAGKLTHGAFGQLKEEFEDIVKLDGKARDEFNDKNPKDAQNLIEKALKKKRAVVDGMTSLLTALQPPQLSPLHANFQVAQSRTVYTEVVLANPDRRPLTYTWGFVSLNDPACVNFTVNTPFTNQAIWLHPDSLCNHALEGPNGHRGVIAVLVTDGKFSCAAVYEGSFTGNGPAPQPCVKSLL